MGVPCSAAATPLVSRMVLAMFWPHPTAWCLPGLEGISQSSAHSSLPWWLRVGRGHFTEEGGGPSMLGSCHPFPDPIPSAQVQDPSIWGNRRVHREATQASVRNQHAALGPGWTIEQKLLTIALGVIPQPQPGPNSGP